MRLALVALKALLVCRIHRIWKRRSRSLYIRPIFLKRDLLGEYQLVRELESDPLYHHKYFRMTKESFKYILDSVTHSISHSVTHMRPITPMQRLAITLRFLATGNSQVSIAMNYRVSPSAVSLILRETMEAICHDLESEYLPPPTSKTWLKNEKGFSHRWNFSNCCGSIDGKHIRCKKPSTSGSEFFNYKSYFSIVLLAVVNANYEFTCVDIGAVGSESDGGVLMRSALGRTFESGTLGIPADKNLPNGVAAPHVIVGDDAFPLRSYMMKPFSGKWLDKDKRIFNYRLSRARFVVENAFGILAARWRIFNTAIACDRSLLILITKTTVILHNFLRRASDFNQILPDFEKDGIFTPGSWREVVATDDGMTDLPRQGSNNYSHVAEDIRDIFKNYFNSEIGKVSWQVAHVSRGY